ncbi:Two component system, signal transduction response regulator [Acididesulfobacillus acetoxydans]|uniref:Stage 0 sporulation protein A homolog n=1 Tax=Acididesulfobacillus acetoxydans TaxID=1561005 RepID=A0A8S0XBA9_9FIRM|nr:response regulator transcription factor [Acididesulfobacillus acetoxydans]CAA7600996.1 Two component system, signal transduction response regulator [Acididesulfobacillus acetoxydans]CEJ07719.1 Response regulator MprA [Acididesulfobacillus acetoxydans]
MPGFPFRILVVDDEPSIREMLSFGLRQEGYTVKTAEHGETALELIPRFDPHVVILDLMMPVMDGYDLCQALPQISQASMIMLTAKNTPADIVRGLKQGANDYLVKPFHFEELLARIEVQLRTRFPDLTGKRQIGSFTLDEAFHLISYRSEALSLSPTEYKLLSHFLWNPDRVLSKTAILDHVWGYDFAGEENIVEVYIRYLRDKLGDKDRKLIQTVRGVGYRFNPD